MYGGLSANGLLYKILIIIELLGTMFDDRVYSIPFRFFSCSWEKTISECAGRVTNLKNVAVMLE